MTKKQILTGCILGFLMMALCMYIPDLIFKSLHERPARVDNYGLGVVGEMGLGNALYYTLDSLTIKK
jgi:hypothetical protein